MPVIVLNNNAAGGGGPPPGTFAPGVIVVGFQLLASDLSDFPVLVDLSRMPDEWWTDVDADGGNIRVYTGTDNTGAAKPCDILNINTGTKTGRLFFKGNLDADADTYFYLDRDPVGTMPAKTDPLGRNAVWSDYHGVFMASDVDFDENRAGTGASDLTLNGGMTVSGGTFVCDGTDDWAQSAVSQFTSWSWGISAQPAGLSGISTIAAYTDGSADANRTSLVRAPGQWEFWNQSDGALVLTGGGALAPAIGLRQRIAGKHDNTTERKGFVNGVLAGTDTGTATKPGGAGDEFNIGAAYSGAEFFNGLLDYAYLRNGLLSDNWLAAEYLSWEKPKTFAFPFTTANVITLAEGQSNDANGQGTVTFEFAIGPPHDDRQVILAISADAANATDVTLVQVRMDGVACTLDAAIVEHNGSASSHVIIARGAPTGTVVTVEIEFSHALIDFCQCMGYVTNVPITVSDTDTQTSVGTDVASLAGTIDVPDGGFLICAGHSRRDTASLTSMAWSGTGVVETYEAIGATPFDADYLGSSAWIPAQSGLASGLSVTMTPSISSRCVLALVSYAI
jgi:hypothetical protein